jgi:rhodanese-related sulfurtransferase
MNYRTLIRHAAVLAALSCASTVTAHAEPLKVNITKDVGQVEAVHNGKKITIMRNQDEKNTVNPAYALTSRACPPFCIQPGTLAPGVETVGELEVLGYIQKMAAGDKSILLIDSRTPDWVVRGTIPGSINLPYTKLDESKGADPLSVTEAMELFGAKETSSGWDYGQAKTLVLFCNGMWCGQSPNNIRTLVKMKYPVEKIKWYRGGMQDWENLGLTTIKP